MSCPEQHTGIFRPRLPAARWCCVIRKRVTKFSFDFFYFVKKGDCLPLNLHDLAHAFGVSFYYSLTSGVLIWPLCWDCLVRLLLLKHLTSWFECKCLLFPCWKLTKGPFLSWSYYHILALMHLYFIFYMVVLCCYQRDKSDLFWYTVYTLLFLCKITWVQSGFDNGNNLPSLHLQACFFGKALQQHTRYWFVSIKGFLKRSNVDT